MKKITKSFMTLFLLMAGLMNVSAATTSVYKIDYSETKAYTFDAMGFSGIGYDAEENALVITNDDDSGNAWDIQPQIAAGYAFDSNCDYKIVITMKADGPGTVQCRIGTWGYEIYQSFSFTSSEEYKDYTINITKPEDASGCFILWQGKKFKGKAVIQKVEIFEIAPDTPPAPKYWYTIFTDDCSSATNFSKKYFKNYLAATADNGAIVVESLDPAIDYTGTYYNENNDHNEIDAIVANDHDVQFLITLPAKLPTGTNVRFSMRNKANKEATAGTQAHAAAPEAGATEGKDGYGGTYLHWALMDNVSFSTDWHTFYKQFKVPSDTKNNMQSICFNLEVLREVNKYFFDDIIVAAELTEEAAAELFPGAKKLNIPLTVSSAGYATFTPAMDVKLPENVKAYTAKLSDSKTSVNLTAITEIPAGTPVIIEAAENDYSLEVLQSAAAVSNNDLLVSDGTITGDGTVYVLANEGDKVGFFKLESGVTLPVGKAYQKIAGESSREFIAINNEATAIKSVETAKVDGAIYNLAGQQVKNAQKGIFIINGKKVVLK